MDSRHTPNPANKNLQVVILAGGYGTRISEESATRPKPMVEIGGHPILWHIMKMYSSHGLNDFVICCGYKGHMIKEYFRDYALENADVRFDLRENTMTMIRTETEPWKVTLVDTGLESMTGGRIRGAAKYLRDGPFCCTYGDGVSDVDITRLIEFHREQGAAATVTAVQPSGRFGVFSLAAGSSRVPSFREKPRENGAWINGGFFVLERNVVELIDGNDTVWERGPMEKLAASGQLAAFRHEGFWQPMDTLRDKQVLEALWQGGHPPWKTW